MVAHSESVIENCIYSAPYIDLIEHIPHIYSGIAVDALMLEPARLLIADRPRRVFRMFALHKLIMSN